MKEVTVPIGRITSQITVAVKIGGFKGWQIRLQVALLLMRFAAKVAGIGIRVDE